MRHVRKIAMASTVAIGIGLSACGGGGSDVASIPPPVPTPTPTPTPTPPPADGPTIQAHPTTDFALLETVVSIGPGGVKLDNATKSAGATLTFAAPANDYSLDIGNPALGVSHVTLSPSGPGSYGADLGGGDRLSLTIDPHSTNLNWTTYGTWDVAMGNGTSTQAAFVTGYQTPVTAVPVGGFASYYGHVSGQVSHPGAGGGADTAALSGEAYLDADFSTGRVGGELYNMLAGTQPWNSVLFRATISGASFAGNTAATTAPGNSVSLGASATGTIAGMFFGPTAKEIGAVWNLSDGAGVAFGTIGGKYDPWGY